MMKYYKKFYEIGNNRYYTIVADDEMFIATESFLTISKKRLFRKPKELITGLKLLKFSTPIALLFTALNGLGPTKKQKYDSDDLITYNHIDNKELKESIKNAYLQVYNEEIELAYQQKNELIKQGKQELVEQCEQYIEKLRNLDLMNGIDLETPEHTGCMIIKTMLREGLEHLYTERVTAFMKNIYLYEQDEFGCLTIYKVVTVKNVVKTIETFIYDKKLIEEFLKDSYEEGR